jgi:hypothetical protein
MEAIEQTFNGTAAFGNKVTATISRNGDLVSRMYVEMDPSACFNNATFVPNPAVCLLKEVELEIGGQRIDKHYSHWMNVWNELTEDTHLTILNGGLMRPSDLTTGGSGTEVARAPTPFQRMSFGVKADGTTAPAETYACVPLQFWFCRNPGLALPLIALQYHEVKVAITFEAESNISSSTTGSLSGVKLFADYIYLDTDERRRFAQVSHEYLIEQVQYQSESAGSTFTLNFNHPVKELVWAGARAAGVNIHAGPGNPSELVLADGTKLARSTASAGSTTTLKLNGHERFSPRHSNYFCRTQVWQHHSHGHGGSKSDAVSVYSFALKPEEHQPSGTCNFSRIDNAQLVFTKAVGGSAASGAHNAGLHIYAVNYNVLRIMSGMGGLAYSN